MKGHSLWDLTAHKDDSVFWKKIISIKDEIVEKAGGTAQAIASMGSWMHGGRFQTRLAYDFLLKHGAKFHWEPIVWKSNVYPRWNFILWLASRDKLRTLDRAQFLERGSVCQLCKQKEETRDHLFFTCKFSSAVWIKVCTFLNFSRRYCSIKRFMDWLTRGKMHSGIPGKSRCIALAATVYFIWEARNAALFDGAIVSCHAVAEKTIFNILRVIHVAKLY